MFSDIASVKRGLTYSPSDVVKKGIRVLRSSNIDVDRFVTFEEDVFVDKNVISIEYAENGDILITSACGSQNLIGKHAKIDNITPNSAVCGGFMLVAKSDYPDFLNASMSSKWYLGFLSTNVSGGNGAIGNLNAKELENQSIYFPKKDERSKIGDLFRRLDDLISLHQRKLEKLKNIKKAMLEKMFI